MTHPRRTRRVSKRRAASLMEIVTASGITTFIMFSLIMMVLTGMKTWTQGQGAIDADLSSQLGMRSISMALREAMSVQLAGDGKSVTYRVPRREGSAYAIPAESDGIDRRIFFDSDTNTIQIQEGGEPRVICRDVVLKDPTNSNQSYRIFSTASSGVVRQITIMLVSQNTTGKDTKAYSRIRETIYLRNVPIMTQ